MSGVTPPVAGAGGGWVVYNADVADCRPGLNPPADLLFCDPPYNFGVDYGKGAAADRLPDERFHRWMRGWLASGGATVKPGGSVAVLLPDEWVAQAAVFLRYDLGYDQRNWVKWHETFGVQTAKKFARCSRHVLHFVKPGGTPYFGAAAVLVPSARQEKYNDKRAAARGKVPGDVWEISRVCGTFAERCEEVPTQIPEELLARVVLAWCPPGGLAREFFAGSGSLGRVCVRTGRRYEGWELDAATAAVAARRVKEAETAAQPGTPG